MVLTEDTETNMDNLVKFIKASKKLIHVDLTNTGLSGKIIELFGSALRRSVSIRSLHLSGNPGLNDPI